MSLNKDVILAGINEAAQRMGLDFEDLIEMIDDVLEDCTSKIGSLRDAAGKGDATQVAAIAHDIKGSTINYGLVAPSEVAKDIEHRKLDAVDRVDELESILLEIQGMGISG